MREERKAKTEKPPIQRRFEEKPKPKVEEKPKAEEKRRLRDSATEDLAGRKIKITLIDGKTLEGNVKEVTRYDLLMDVNGKTMIVMKHHISLIEL
jgi:sRNA-binding regulator protein Hfq